MKLVNSSIFIYLRRSFLRSLLHPLWRCYFTIMRKRRMRKYAYDMLYKVNALFNENHIDYWLDFGTLLGAIREKDFISHDLDLDLGAFYEDSTKIVSIIKECKYFIVSHEYWVNNEISQISFEYNGLNLDICFYHRIDSRKLYCYLCYFNGNIALNKKNNQYNVSVAKCTVPFEGIIDIDFKGINVHIPKDYDGYLKADYGNNYMIPDTKFDFKRDAPNIYIYHENELLGVCINY